MLTLFTKDYSNLKRVQKDPAKNYVCKTCIFNERLILAKIRLIEYLLNCINTTAGDLWASETSRQKWNYINW